MKQLSISIYFKFQTSVFCKRFFFIKVSLARLACQNAWLVKTLYSSAWFPLRIQGVYIKRKSSLSTVINCVNFSHVEPNKKLKNNTP